MEMLVIQFSCIDLGVDVWIRQIKHDQLNLNIDCLQSFDRLDKK